MHKFLSSLIRDFYWLIAIFPLNGLTSSVVSHGTVHPHKQVFLDEAKYFDPPRNLRVAIDIQRWSRVQILHQTRNVIDLLKPNRHRHIHLHRLLRLRLPGRGLALSDDLATVINFCRGFWVFEGCNIRVFHGDACHNDHLTVWWKSGKMNYLIFLKKKKKKCLYFSFFEKVISNSPEPLFENDRVSISIFGFLMWRTVKLRTMPTTARIKRRAAKQPQHLMYLCVWRRSLAGERRKRSSSSLQDWPGAKAAKGLTCSFSAMAMEKWGGKKGNFGYLIVGFDLGIKTPSSSQSAVSGVLL